MWQHVLKRTKTYRREHRRHLAIDGLLVAAILALGVLIVFEKRPSSPVPAPTPLELRLTTEVRYLTTTGEQIGTGPHPPIVGERTTYWVFFTAGADGTTSQNTTLVVKLAEHVEWTGQGSIAGTGWIAAPADQAVVADLGSLPSQTIIQGTLELAITPQEMNELLVDQVILTGQDERGHKVSIKERDIR